MHHFLNILRSLYIFSYHVTLAKAVVLAETLESHSKFLDTFLNYCMCPYWLS